MKTLYSISLLSLVTIMANTLVSTSADNELHLDEASVDEATTVTYTGVPIVQKVSHASPPIIQHTPDVVVQSGAIPIPTEAVQNPAENKIYKHHHYHYHYHINVGKAQKKDELSPSPPANDPK